MKEKFVINLEAHLAIFNEEIQASLVGYLIQNGSKNPKFTKTALCAKQCD